MSRLQKFIELKADEGRSSGRAAYVLDATRLPPPSENCTWKLATNFNAADEILANPDLKSVYKQAIGEGCSVVTTGR